MYNLFFFFFLVESSKKAIIASLWQYIFANIAVSTNFCDSSLTLFLNEMTAVPFSVTQKLLCSQFIYVNKLKKPSGFIKKNNNT